MMTIRKNVKKKAKKIEKKTCINNSTTSLPLLLINFLCNLKELKISVIHLVFKAILSDSNEILMSLSSCTPLYLSHINPVGPGN